jgi:hypothetical protein
VRDQRQQFRRLIFRNLNMIELKKSDCTDSIAIGVNHTKRWRDKMKLKYSFDSRNARAAESLAKLTTEAVQLTDGEWLQLQPHFDLSPKWREAVSQTARLVGFTFRIKDIHSFVEHLLDVLSQPQVVA